MPRVFPGVFANSCSHAPAGAPLPRHHDLDGVPEPMMVSGKHDNSIQAAGMVQVAWSRTRIPVRAKEKAKWPPPLPPRP